MIVAFVKGNDHDKKKRKKENSISCAMLLQLPFYNRLKKKFCCPTG